MKKKEVSNLLPSEVWILSVNPLSERVLTVPIEQLLLELSPMVVIVTA